MNIHAALRTAAGQLTDANITSASLDAELLLARVLDQPREALLAHSEDELSNIQQREFFSLVNQRTKHIPIAYLTHEAYFYGRPFYVDERVLVPRPETEMIIDALKIMTEEADTTPATIIDIGTGSGCIIVTAAQEIGGDTAQFIATDVSAETLLVAEQNAQTHGVSEKITFLQGNLLEPIKHQAPDMSGRVYITANLPYVTTGHLDSEPSIQFEPRIALDGGADGLDHYRALAQQAEDLGSITAASAPAITLLCEIGEEQGAAMRDIFSFAQNVDIKKDLAGRDRVVIIKI